jgi:RNA polymerase sigma factor (TIGR02999 family)
MTTPVPQQVTELLVAWSNGDQAALDQLTPLVYEELHRLAHHYMSRERSDHTLQTSALVNEAYIHLVDQNDLHWQNRAQFFGLAAQLMRHILVDHARAHTRAKRGGGRKVALDDFAVLNPERGAELIALDEALKRLAALHPRKGQVVELKFFGGLTVEEIAEVLKVSPVTVMRDWSFAKSWLHREIANDA